MLVFFLLLWLSEFFFFTFCYFWNDRKWRGLNVFEMFELKGSIDLINVRMMFEICKGG